MCELRHLTMIGWLFSARKSEHDHSGVGPRAGHGAWGGRGAREGRGSAECLVVSVGGKSAGRGSRDRTASGMVIKRKYFYAPQLE